MCGYSMQLTVATGITTVMLRRKILMSKQLIDVPYSFLAFIATYISAENTGSLHIGSWLVGAGVGLVEE